VVSALLLQACSTVKLAYTQAPHLAVWQLQRYLDLSDDQTQRVRDEVNGLHHWHRNAMLTEHAQWLQAAKAELPGHVTAEQACRVYEGFRMQLDRLVEQATPAMLWLATQLSDSQIRHLQQRQAASNADWRKEWLLPSAQALHEHRYKQLLSRAEGLYGRLDGPQKTALRAAIVRSSFDPRRAYEERTRRQQDMVATLRAISSQPADSAQVQALVNGYLQRLAHSPDAAYRDYARTLVLEGCEAFAQVHSATTPAQRQKAVQTMAGYAADFVALASR
jgi:hypothetical protein